MDTQDQLPQAQIPDQHPQPARGSDANVISEPPALPQQTPHVQAGRGDEDTNLNEQDRQYIDRAIAAVEENVNDPYMQSNAINQIRTDYLGARFGKQINSDA